MSRPRQNLGASQGHEVGASKGRFSPRFFLALDPRRAPTIVEASRAATIVDLTGDPSTPDDELPPGERLTLGAEDSHHALKVLRLRIGDECEVVSPARRVYRVVVSGTTIPLQLTVVAPLAREEAGPLYRTEVGLVQAFTRPSVMDYVLEKGTEVGADFFLLVDAAGSPRRSEASRADRLERWTRIVREAAKQSKQTRLPRIAVSPSIADALCVLEVAGTASVVLDPRASRSLPQILEEGAPARVGLWIGPEGGWTAAEWDSFRTAEACGARLGRSILRTETAGPVAVAIARLALHDW